MIDRLLKGAFSYRTGYRLPSYYRSVLLIIVKLICADINRRLIGAISSVVTKKFLNKYLNILKI